MNNILNKNIRKIVFIFATFLILSNILKVQLYASENSINYIIEDKYITRVLSETTVEIFKNKLAKENIEITNKNGEILNDTDIIVTGTNVKIEESLYKVSVIGDINGDGKVTNEDVIKGEKYFINIDKIENEYLKSIDINNDGKYTITDLVQMNLIASSEKKIEDFIKKDFKEEPLFGMPEKEYDPDGDEDGDGLTNAEEEALGTNINEADSDHDGLIDYYEVNVSKTNPLLADTDGDGINDGDELPLGLDPLKEDSKGDGIKDGERELTYTVESKDTDVNIEITGKGNIVNTTIDAFESNSLSDVEGLLNTVYNFYTDGIMKKSIVKIKYDLNEIQKKQIQEDDLTIYYLNEKEKELEIVNTTVDKENKQLIAELEHFSNYIIGDKNVAHDKLKLSSDEWIDTDGDGKIDSWILANSGFLPEKDGFSFANYSSVQSEGGNCYGMATFAMLYYNKQLPKKMSDAEYDMYEKLIHHVKFEAQGYDLTNTYFDSYEPLYDYKMSTEGLKTYFYRPEDYRDRIENRTYMINNTYAEMMKNIGISIKENKCNRNDFDQYQKAVIDSYDEKLRENITSEESNLLNAIYRLFVEQAIDEEIGFGDSPDKAFSALKESLNNNIPIVIGINGNHAINAVKLIQQSPNKYKIEVYDNNYPGEKRYIYVTRIKFNKIQLNFTAWVNEYDYSFQYDSDNDGILEDMEYLDVCYLKKDEIYASLYDDGTLAFTAKNEPLEGKTLVKSYGDISYKEFKYSNDVPWYSDRESITNVDIIDKISPVSTAYWFSECNKITEIKNISNLDTSNVTDMSWMFDECSSLVSLDVSSFDTSNVINMDGMFAWCDSLTNLDVSKFDTKNVTDMSSMFYDCKSLTNLDVSKFDTSNVTDMSWMFMCCSKLKNLDISNFNTSNVIDMNCMFNSCSSLTNLDVSKFDTKNVTDMSSMFYDCKSLTNLDVSKFDTKNVTDMNCMFFWCNGLSFLNVNNFDTSNVVDMSFMFVGCKLSKLELSNFNTSNVTDMNSMFSSCSNLTSLDLSNFNTSNVTNMDSMFDGCENLTSLDLSSFDTKNVLSMESMFEDCKKLYNLNISNFNTGNVIYMNRMFYRCENLSSLDINNFNTSNVMYMKEMFYGCEKLTQLDLSNFDTKNVVSILRLFAYDKELTIIYVGPNWQVPDNTDIRGMFDYCGTQEVTRK